MAGGHNDNEAVTGQLCEPGCSGDAAVVASVVTGAVGRRSFAPIIGPWPSLALKWTHR